MSETSAKPESTPTDLSSPYWQGLARSELQLQSCAQCGKLRHYPRLLCDECYHDGVNWHAASGRGRIHSWTVAHHPFHPGFAGQTPYTLVTVDLEEGPRALGLWLGDELAIGTAVQARFMHSHDRTELAFEPASAP